MSWQQIMSILVFLSSIGLLIVFNVVYDVIVILKYGPDASISRAMLRLSQICPVAPCLIVGIAMLFIGLLMGHFWWRN